MIRCLFFVSLIRDSEKLVGDVCPESGNLKHFQFCFKSAVSKRKSEYWVTTMEKKREQRRETEKENEKGLFQHSHCDAN